MRHTLAALLALTPSIALAHEGHHEQMSQAQSLHHLLTQPDHVLALAALLAITAGGGWTWLRHARTRK